MNSCFLFTSYKQSTTSLSFFKKIMLSLFFFFLMWTIFKVFIGFVTILRLFYVLAFDHEAYGILVPQPGVTAAPPVLEGNALST